MSKNSTTLQLVIPDQPKTKTVASYAKGNNAYINRLSKMPITVSGKPKATVAMYFVLIDPKRLVLDPSYQLESRQLRDVGLTKKWDIKLCEPIQVNFRDGKYLSVINGVHRCRAAATKGIEKLPAYLYIGLSKDDEIKMFVNQDGGTVKVQPKEKFLALVAAGDPTASYMMDVFKKYNFEVRLDGRTKSRFYNIQGLAAINDERLTLAEDERWKEWLDWMFSIFNYCNWGHILGCTEKNNITAFAAVYKKNFNSGTLEQATENLLKVMYTYGPQHMKVVADMAFQHKDHSANSRRKNLYLSIADGTYTLETMTIDFADKFKEMGLDKYLPNPKPSAPSNDESDDEA